MTPWRCPGRFSRQTSPDLAKIWAFLGEEDWCSWAFIRIQKVDYKYLVTAWFTSHWKSTWHSPYTLVYIYSTALWHLCHLFWTVRYKYLKSLNMLAITMWISDGNLLLVNIFKIQALVPCHCTNSLHLGFTPEQAKQIYKLWESKNIPPMPTPPRNSRPY